MRRLGLIVTVLVALLASGCGWSLWPYFTEEDLVFDEGLLGAWYSDTEQDSPPFIVTRHSENAYRIEHGVEEGVPSVLLAHLFELGSQRFLDVTVMRDWLWDGPEHDGGLVLNELLLHHMVTVHTVFKVKEMGGRLVITALDPEWIEEQGISKKHRFPLMGQEDESMWLLGMSTKKLQGLLRKALKEPEAFQYDSDDLDLTYTRTPPDRAPGTS